MSTIESASSVTPVGRETSARRLLGGRSVYADGVPVPEPFCVLLLSMLGDLSLWLGRPCAASLALPLERTSLEVIAHLDDGTVFLVDRRQPTDDPRIAALRRILVEPPVRHLAASLSTVIDDPLPADAVFVERVALAIHAHVSSRLTFARATCPERGGLARWQQERASELLLRHPGRSVPLGELAGACRLSVSHFVRAFRKSTGLPPHRWLVVRRIGLCKDLLLTDRERPLADIALACGFADQSHFTRTFSRIAGMTPGAWRRHALA